jgi:hypothetical protein
MKIKVFQNAWDQSHKMSLKMHGFIIKMMQNKKKNSKREAMNQEDLKKLTIYETKYQVKCMG